MAKRIMFVWHKVDRVTKEGHIRILYKAWQISYIALKELCLHCWIFGLHGLVGEPNGLSRGVYPDDAGIGEQFVPRHFLYNQARNSPSATGHIDNGDGGVRGSCGSTGQEMLDSVLHKQTIDSRVEIVGRERRKGKLIRFICFK